MNQMQQMLMQAQKMQRELDKAHTELAAKEFTVKKAGIVTVILTGDKKLKELTIEPDALNAENAEMIQDTVVMAVNEALDAIDNEETEITERITGRKGGLPF